MKNNKFSLHLTFLLMLFLVSGVATAQTSNIVYSDGNVSIVQQTDGWQVMHFKKVVAHGDGIIDTQNLPPAFKDFLDHYARKSKSSRTLRSKATSYTYGPLVETQWNQTTPFNDQFPLIDDQHALTGCTSISSAQVMNYYGYCNPFSVSGSMSIYNYNKIESEYISNVSKQGNIINYDYAYNCTPNFNNLDDNELAKFILGIAFAQKATLGVSETSTNSYYQQLAFTELYGYTAERYDISSLDDRSLIADAIRRGQPVIIDGQSSTGGHSFIIDGYDGTFYHINYGWGGHNDGWFAYTDYPIGMGITLVQPNVPNSTFMQSKPTYLHITGNGIDHKITMQQSSPDGLLYVTTIPADLSAGEYEFWFEYPDGTTIAPYTTSTIDLQQKYNHHGCYSTTPSKFYIDNAYNITFSHNVAKGEISIDIADQQLSVSGKVVDENGQPIAGAYISTQKQTPRPTVISENTNPQWGGVTAVPPVNFVPTQKYLTQIDILMFCGRGTPKSDAVLTLSNKERKTIWQYTVPNSQLRIDVWKQVILDNPIALTPGDNYYLSIATPGNDNENFWFIACDEQHNWIYHIRGTDQLYSISDQDGKYSVNIDKFYDGPLYAIDSKKTFEPININNLTDNLTNQNFQGLSKLVNISGKVLTEDGQGVPGTTISMSDAKPQHEAFNKNDDRTYNNFMLFHPYKIEFVPAKKYLTQIDFAVAKEGSPENILFDIKDEDGHIIWNLDLPDSKINDYEWTSISLDDWLEVTPGKTYTLTLTTGANNDYDNRYFYYKASDQKIVYRIWSTDEFFANTDNDGNYTIKAERYSAGKLYAFNDNYIIEPLTIENAKQSLQNQNFAALNKDVTISGKVTDKHGNSIQGAYVSLTETAPQSAIEKESESTGSCYYSSYFNNEYYTTQAIQLQKKYITAVEFNTYAYGSPSDLTVAILDKNRNAIWQKTYTRTEINNDGWTKAELENALEIMSSEDYYLGLWNTNNDYNNMYLFYCDANNNMPYHVYTSNDRYVKTDNDGRYAIKVERYSSGKLYAHDGDKDFNAVDYNKIADKISGQDFQEINNEVLPISIEIATLPSKLTYIVGNTLDINGGFITVNYNNNTTEKIAISDAMVSGFDNSKIGTQTLTVEYLGLKTTFDVTVNDKTATSIEIATLPSKLTYIVGNSLDINGGFITVNYNNNTTEKVAISDAMVSGFDNSKIGTQTLTVEYLGLQTTFDVTVNDKTATSIEIATLPSKLTYIVGNTLDINGGFITVNYNNNTTEKVAISNAMVSGFDNTKIGAQTLTVEYLGLKTTFDITVNDKTATSIEIATLPSKLTYIVGNTLDINGGFITVDYNNNTTEKVAISDAMVSGFDNTKIGAQTLTVEYLGLQTTFDVTVNDKTATSIEIATLPSKLTYIVGNTLDINGGFITVNYNNNTTEKVAISDAMVSGFDNSKIGTQTLTVEYLGLQTTFDVTVNDKTATSIEIATLPSKLTYIVGNTLDINGGFITINYNNNTTEKVAISDAMVSGFDNTKIGAQTLTVEYLELKTTFDITVNDKTATSIEIATLPSKLTYIVGNTLDINGGFITVNYNNNTTEKVAISDAMVSGFDNTKIGAQTLTVEYLGLGTTFDVTVEAKPEDKPIEEDPIEDNPDDNPIEDNPETATENIIANNTKIWSFDKTIVIENGGKEIRIVDMSGRTIKTVNADNQRTEIPMQKSGIYIVKTGLTAQKVIIK